MCIDHTGVNICAYQVVDVKRWFYLGGSISVVLSRLFYLDGSISLVLSRWFYLDGSILVVLSRWVLSVSVLNSSYNHYTFIPQYVSVHTM